jgi:mRNA interferase RelE/StbE
VLPSAAGYEPTARPRRTPRRTSSATESQTYTVVLSAVARRAIGLDLSEAVAVAVVDFLYGPLAADPYRVGKRLHFELQDHWSARRGQ